MLRSMRPIFRSWLPLSRMLKPMLRPSTPMLRNVTYVPGLFVTYVVGLYTLRSFPPTLGSVARTLLRVPRTLRSVPRTLSNVTRTLRSVPSTLQSVPYTLRNVPRILRSVPRTLGSVLNILESVPRILRKVPATLGSVPRTLSKVPRTLRGFLRSPDACPRADHHPAPSGRQPGRVLSGFAPCGEGVPRHARGVKAMEPGRGIAGGAGRRVPLPMRAPARSARGRIGRGRTRPMLLYETRRESPLFARGDPVRVRCRLCGDRPSRVRRGGRPRRRRSR